MPPKKSVKQSSATGKKSGEDGPSALGEEWAEIMRNWQAVAVFDEAPTNGTTSSSGRIIKPPQHYVVTKVVSMIPLSSRKNLVSPIAEKSKEEDKSTTTTAVEGAPTSQMSISAESIGSEQRCPEAPTAGDDKKLFAEFMKSTLEKGGDVGLRAEFRGIIKRECDLSEMKAFVDNAPKGKNIYEDVACLDISSVKLNEFADGDYIHANYVETPASKERFICTQVLFSRGDFTELNRFRPPQEETCADFWAMVIQEKVENILMLCNLNDAEEYEECYEYFVSKENKELTFGEYKVRYISQKKFEFICETQAKIVETVMECEFKDKKQKTSHYHWVDWPDRGVPPAAMAVIELLAKVKSTRRPIVVHCSAGVGRTGPVVLIQSILDTIQANQEVQPCDKLLKKLRDQRMHLLETVTQYVYVHDILIKHWNADLSKSEDEVCDVSTDECTTSPNGNVAQPRPKSATEETTAGQETQDIQGSPATIALLYRQEAESLKEQLDTQKKDLIHWRNLTKTREGMLNSLFNRNVLAHFFSGAYFTEVSSLQPHP